MTPSEAEKLVARLEADPGRCGGNVLDVRTRQAFAAGHLRGAASIPLEDGSDGWTVPADLERILPSIHLPPRNEPLLVVASRQEASDRLAARLAARGRSAVSGQALTESSLEMLPDSWLEAGNTTHHLWKPPLWLAAHLDMLPPPAAGPVLDLACGSGRAMVWLAEKGYRVTGIDWQPEALELGRSLASDRGVECRFVKGDLRATGVVPEGPWAVVLNFRFRQVELLDRMCGWLKPGGVALVRTFRSAPGYEGHPSLRHRLEPGELLRYFPTSRCQVLAHEESHDPDGRPAAGIVARKI